MNGVLKKIGELKLLPVIKIENLETAVPLADALCDGGLPAAEITFRTACAPEAIAAVKNAFPEMLVGAGTVLSVEQVKAALSSGAEFIVSPGFNPEVVRYCAVNGIPIVPGCITPTEIEMALSYGLEVVKFFPASAYGGISTIKALHAPYQMIRFIPTGGIGLNNLAEYVSDPAVFACGGSFMVKDSLIKESNYGKIKELTAEAVGIIKSIK